MVFSDDKVDVLIPINFTASAESAKNTECCRWLFSPGRGTSSYFHQIFRDADGKFNAMMPI